MKKISGNSNIIVNKKETLLFTFRLNTIYVYSIPEFQCIAKYKSLSNISFLAISDDDQKLAVLNTSGKIAVIDLSSGQELGTCSMTGEESFSPIYFLSDNQHVLFYSPKGEIILLNTADFTYRVICYFKDELSNPNTIYSVYYNKDQNLLIGIDSGNNTVYQSDLNEIQFKSKKLQIDGEMDASFDTSFVVHPQYYLSIVTKHHPFRILEEIYVWDHQFEIVKKVPLPIDYILRCMRLSLDGKRLFGAGFSSAEIEEKDLAILYDFETMEPIKEYDLEYFHWADFICQDKYLILSTFKGVYIDKLE